MEGQETKYPPFLAYINSTNTLSFRPVDKWTQGHTYFFQIVIKERNSVSVLYKYYCTVKIEGDPYFKNETTPWVNVLYSVDWISDDSHGSMKFSEPVNMDYLRQNDNFYKMFDIYYQDINYRTNKENWKLRNFVVDEWGWQGDEMTINFTMTWDKPYMLGLLLKKSDKLFIDQNKNFTIDKEKFFKNTTKYGDDRDNDTYGNATIHRLWTNSSSRRIEMQFDYRNPNMKLYRRVAYNMYWVMIALILTQFLLLLWRGVGLLPVWILIEYL